MSIRYLLCYCWVFLSIPLIAQTPSFVVNRIVEQQGAALVTIPLPNATVRIDSTIVLFSDETGAIILPSLSNGTHRMSVSHVGFVTHIQDFVIPIDKTVLREINLEPVLLKVVEINATQNPNMFAANSMVITQKNSPIHQRNVGQDLSFLLQNSTSVVVTSDAGTGIGYTGIRVRGTDATRINTTINDIPLNDPESHQVYWVDVPDIVSSANNLQIQRGAGSSTNGAGAFGASVQLQTAPEEATPYVQIDHAFGSFQSQRHSLSLGTGKLQHWSGDARLGYIGSEGYVDRAFARLLSYHSQIKYMDTKNIFRFMAFGGQERTYQAWGGVPEEVMDTNRTYNPYTYKNQVDNYRQHHYQAHYSRYWNNHWTSKTSLHYTKGKGYYEQYETDQTLSDYGINNTTLLNASDSTLVTTSDLVTRKWLDNDFYGVNMAIQYQNDNTQIIANTSWNNYVGKHFGEIIWANIAPNSQVHQHYYDGLGNKQEWNSFAKIQYQLNPFIQLYGDLQARWLRYDITGTADQAQALDYHLKYIFINPKIGINYHLTPKSQVSFQYSKAQREPTRSNIIDNNTLPKAETLYDFELGYHYNKSQKTKFGINLYYMNYHNQLVLTGNLNDVGAPIQQNVPHSYRVGIEGDGTCKLSKRLSWEGNLTYSRNKIRSFEFFTSIFTPDWGYIADTSIVYKNTNIAFSPQIIASSQWVFQPWEQTSITLNTKYVGTQFIDNTQSKQRRLPAYSTTDLVIAQQWQLKWCKQLTLSLHLNNIFNAQYESNAWTYFILFQQQDQQILTTSYNNYYPQAGANVFVKLSCRL